MQRTQTAAASETQVSLSEFERLRPTYDNLRARLEALLQQLLTDLGVQYDLIEGRTKTVESCREKMQRPGKNYGDPIRDITDLIGLRIVLYYVDDIPSTCGLIKEQFNVDPSYSVDKADLLKPHEMGYLSIHYVASLAPPRTTLPEWKTFVGYRFEIQVRTVLQHAWAAISHALDYKREPDVPTMQRRKLFRLAGLLELADEEFSQLRTSKAEYRVTTESEIRTGETDLEVNAVTIKEYLKTSPLVRSLSQMAKRTGFGMHVRKVDPTDVVKVSSDRGCRSVKDVELLLEQSRGKWETFLNVLWRIHKAKAGTSWSASPDFVVLLVLMATSKGLTGRYLVDEFQFSPSIAEEVVSAAQEVWPEGFE